jgi:hypothetical protein
MSVVKDKKQQYKVKNSRTRRRLAEMYSFIKYFSLSSLSYSLSVYAYKVLNNQ